MIKHQQGIFMVLLIAFSLVTSMIPVEKYSIIDVTIRLQKYFDQISNISYLHKNIKKNAVDLLGRPYGKNHVYQFLVMPEARNLVYTKLRHLKIPFIINRPQLHRIIQQTNKLHIPLGRTRRSLSTYDFEKYLSTDEIYNWLHLQAAKTPFMKIINLGKTNQKLDLIAVKISKNENLPIILIDAGIHAREWISISSAHYFIKKMTDLTDASNQLLNRFQFYVIPILNPDGYEYSRQKNRFWRKNRSFTNLGNCVGVDLNRNFPYYWGGEGSSRFSCQNLYRGSHPASELETQHFIKFVNELVNSRSTIKVYLSLHTFGGYLMYPYGYKKFVYPRDIFNIKKVSLVVSKTVYEKFKYTFKVNSSSEALYVASGGSEDYMAGVLNVDYSFGIELASKGFVTPEDEIRKHGEILFCLVKTMADQIETFK